MTDGSTYLCYDCLVSLQVVTAATASRRGLLQSGVNVAYAISAPTSLSPTALTAQLQSLVQSGVVTNALAASGFPNAVANNVIIILATPRPTPAPTLLAPGPIAGGTLTNLALMPYLTSIKS